MSQTSGRLILFRAQLRAQAQGANSDMRSVGAWSMMGLLQGMESKLPALQARAISLANQVRDFFKRTLQIRSPSRVFAGLGGFITQGLAQGIDRGSGEPLARVRRMAALVGAAGAISLPSPSLASPIPDMAGDPASSPAGTAAGLNAVPRALRLAGLVGGGRDRSERLQEISSSMSSALQRGAAIGRSREEPAPRTPSPRNSPSPAPIGKVEIHIHAAPGQSAEGIAAAARREFENLMRQEAAAQRSSFDDD
jgi:hypothetical protein